jgi:putative PIN family toxin of toxin-antitoxin system
LPRKAKKQKSRGVVDTNVLVAGISGFRKPYVRGKNTSADVLYKWAEKGNFVWLVTEDILDEYKEVLKRLRVRSTLIGAVISLIRERAELVNVHASFEFSPDPKDDPFCLCSEEGNADFIVTLNPKDFRKNGPGQRSFHPKPCRSKRRCRSLMNTSVRFRTGRLRRQIERRCEARAGSSARSPICISED